KEAVAIVLSHYGMVERKEVTTCWGTPFPVSAANEVGKAGPGGLGHPLTPTIYLLKTEAACGMMIVIQACSICRL
ncbi:MAG: hypothetical protein JWL77_3028, partial [Chthonomonadaceae bacterium]|nr:hypothetical protein [Chthonomonadaceae bacterium]